MKKEKRKTCGPAFKNPPRPLFRTKQNKTSCLLGRKKKGLHQEKVARTPRNKGINL